MPSTLSSHDVIGSPIEDLDTPALLLDGPASDRNIERMADFFRDKECQLRPHFKNHKCTTLARRQLEAGNAVGITCAKLGEAEVLGEHGIDNVLIANQVVGRRKIARLVALAKKIQLRVAVDDADQARSIAEAAAAGGATVGVLIEVDIGMGRCGVAPGDAAVNLAKQIVNMPGLRFDGIQAYEGHIVNVQDADERAKLTRTAMKQAVDTRRLIEEQGIPVSVISGGSTATYEITGTMEGVKEIQAGTYPTMDWCYAQRTPQFELALSVLARVISKRPDGAVLDVGAKGLGGEFGPPRIKDQPDTQNPCSLAEEHLVVKGALTQQLAEAVQLIPSHACTTSNLYRQFHVHADGRVIDVWPIEASGKLA